VDAGVTHRILVLLRQHRRQRDKVGNDGHDVDDVHHVLEEIPLVRTADDAHYDLEREPHYADRLYEEERVRKVGHFVLLDPRPVVGRVEQLVVLELGQSL